MDPTVARDAVPWLVRAHATLLKDAAAVPTPAATIVEQQAAVPPPICVGHKVPRIRLSG
jgi:hypothetical protein